jgi:hypothetical protein
MAGKKAKMGHSKFEKFNKSKAPEKKRDRYRIDGDVCNGFRVIDSTDESVVLETRMMWDAIDLQRKLNAPV